MLGRLLLKIEFEDADVIELHHDTSRVVLL
jgi:hypothetical protein